MCQHQPQCPHWPAPDHLAARMVADHPDQGWCLLCNGVIVFDDGGELLPDDSSRAPRLDGTMAAGPTPASCTAGSSRRTTARSSVVSRRSGHRHHLH